MASYVRMLGKLTGPVRFPALAKFLAGACPTGMTAPGDEFIFGLERILDGIGVLLTAVPARHPE